MFALWVCGNWLSSRISASVGATERVGRWSAGGECEAIHSSDTSGSKLISWLTDASENCAVKRASFTVTQPTARGTSSSFIHANAADKIPATPVSTHKPPEGTIQQTQQWRHISPTSVWSVLHGLKRWMNACLNLTGVSLHYFSEHVTWGKLVWSAYEHLSLCNN